MILADDILDMVGTPMDVGGMASGFAGGVTKAQRFVYSEDTASALCRLATSKPETLLAALPLCRAPFPIFWLEWPGSVGVTAQTVTTPERLIPKTFGVLVRSMNEEGTRLGLMFAWSFGREQIGIRPPNNLPLVNLCPVSCEIDILAPEGDALWGTSPFALDFLEAVRERSGGKKADALLKEAVLDVQCEIPWVIAALCLLSAKGGVEKQRVDLSRLNKARIRRGVRPLAPHSTVKIALTPQEADEARAAGLSRAEMRQHIVRGHFKVRSGGVYWWRPFIRGKIEAGEVKRSGYRVTRT